MLVTVGLLEADTATLTQADYILYIYAPNPRHTIIPVLSIIDGPETTDRLSWQLDRSYGTVVVVYGPKHDLLVVATEDVAASAASQATENIISFDDPSLHIDNMTQFWLL